MDAVKELRERTGVSVVQCKKALLEAGGDLEKAVKILRQKSAAEASKKSERALGSSAIASYVHGGGDAGALVELSSETDFVSKNEEFRSLARDIAMHVVAMKPRFLSRAEVPENEIKEMKKMFEEEAEKEGKPKEITKKISESKLDTYLKENTLLEQKFVKNPEFTIEDLVHNAVQKFGENIAVVRFARYSSGR